MAKSTHLNFRVSDELKADLKKLADADRRELSVYARLVLEDHVATKKAAGKRK